MILLYFLPFNIKIKDKTNIFQSNFTCNLSNVFTFIFIAGHREKLEASLFILYLLQF